MRLRRGIAATSTQPSVTAGASDGARSASRPANCPSCRRAPLRKPRSAIPSVCYRMLVNPAKGNVITLRDVTEPDLPIFFEHQCEPEGHRMAGFRPREYDAFMLHWRTRVLGDPAARKRTIVVDGRVAGNIGSWDADGRRFVGYWIGREHWGRGIATAALSQFLREESTRPLYAYVVVRNVGSIRVLQKCGFRQFGDMERHPDGVEEYCFQLDAQRLPSE